MCEGLQLFGRVEPFQSSYGQIFIFPFHSEPLEAAEEKTHAGLCLSSLYGLGQRDVQAWRKNATRVGQ